MTRCKRVKDDVVQRGLVLLGFFLGVGTLLPTAKAAFADPSFTAFSNVHKRAADQVAHLVAKHFAWNQNRDLVYRVDFSGAYALAAWTSGSTGGRSLYRYDHHMWTDVTSMQNGADEGVLESDGVPTHAAIALAEPDAYSCTRPVVFVMPRGGVVVCRFAEF